MRTRSFALRILGTVHKNISSPVLAALVLLPAIIAASILYTQRLPFPYQDDFSSLLAFADQYKNAPGMGLKASLIALAPYGSYRLIFLHIIVGAEVQLTHHLNFAFLTALGDFFLLGIFFLLWCLFEGKPLKDRLVSFLPVSLIFFCLSYWETMNWAMTGLQNVPVIFFALLAIYLLGPQPAPKFRTTRFIFACLAALLSCCSSPNGFLLAPVGLLMLASQRDYKRAILWLLSFILPLLSYLHHPVMEPSKHPSFQKQIFYIIAFSGGAFGFRPVAFLVGLALLAVCLWAAPSYFKQQNSILFPFALWILLTGILVESIRTSINSRYTMYSVLMMVCCYSFVLRHLRRDQPALKRGVFAYLSRRRFLEVAVALSLCIYIPESVRAYGRFHRRREMVLKGYRYYRANPQSNSPQVNPLVDLLVPSETPYELQVLKQVDRDGLYSVPPMQDLQP